MKKPLIVMFSDFGLDTGFVASMHGVCKIVDPDLEIHDATHQIRAFDVRAASHCLQYTVPYWPNGTVFVCVVDPGVGTERKASVAKLSNGSYVVTPDNGTLTFLDKMIGVEEIREIDENVNRFPARETVSVFHGRDLFAYCAAKLASGKITFEEVGAQYPIKDMVKHPVHISEIRPGYAKGVIESSDSFGTVETNFLNAEFVKTTFKLGEVLNITISIDEKIVFNDKVIYYKTFGCVDEGKAILFNDLASFVALGLNQDNFAKKYGIEEGKVYDITVQRDLS